MLIKTSLKDWGSNDRRTVVSQSAMCPTWIPNDAPLNQEGKITLKSTTKSATWEPGFRVSIHRADVGEEQAEVGWWVSVINGGDRRT